MNEVAWFLSTLVGLIVGVFTNKYLLKSIDNEKQEFAKILDLPFKAASFLLFDKYVAPERSKTAHACTIKLKYKNRRLIG